MSSVNSTIYPNPHDLSLEAQQAQRDQMILQVRKIFYDKFFLILSTKTTREQRKQYLSNNVEFESRVTNDGQLYISVLLEGLELFCVHYGADDPEERLNQVATEVRQIILASHKL